MLKKSYLLKPTGQENTNNYVEPLDIYSSTEWQK